MRTSMNFSDRFQVQLSIVFCLQIWKPVVCSIQQLHMNNFLPNTSNLAGYLHCIYKSIFLIHALKEQLGDILFISFVIVSVRNCVRWGYYLLFWMNCVADLLWLLRSFYLLYAALPVGSFVEWDFFIRILLKVYYDFAE